MIPKIHLLPSISDNFYIIAKAAGILVAIIFIYWDMLGTIFQHALIFSAGNISNYVLIVPALIGYVLYRKRNILKVVAGGGYARNRKDHLFEETFGIILCLLAVIFLYHGLLVAGMVELLVVSLMLLVAGATVLLFNIKTLRHSIFAIILLLYLQPPPSELVSGLAADSSWITALFVENVLRMLSIPVSLETSIGAPAILLEHADGAKIPYYVGEPSSGISSLISMSLQALFVAYLVRDKIWKRAIIFGSSLPLFLMLNMLRINIIILLAYYYGPEVSESFHVVGGVLMATVGMIILLIVAERIMGLTLRGAKQVKKECKICESCLSQGQDFCSFCGRFFGRVSVKTSKRNLGRILMLSLVVALVIPVGSEVEAVPSKVSELDISSLDGAEAKEYFLPEIEGWSLDYGFRDERIESVLSQDAALVFLYRPISQNDTDLASKYRTSIYAAIQISNSKHTWESSLLIYPSKVGRPTAKVFELRDIEIPDAPDGRLFIYKRPGSTSTEAVLYWFERVPLRFDTELQYKNIQIILWTYTNSLARAGFIKSYDDVAGAEEILMSMAKPVASFWKEIRSSVTKPSTVQSVINNWSGDLAKILVSSAFFISANHYLKDLRGKNATKKKVARLIHSDEKMLVDASVEASNHGNPTAEYISKIYEKKSNSKKLAATQVLNTLQNAQRSNLVETDVISNNDEPMLVWIPSFVSISFLRLRDYLRWLSKNFGY